MKKLIVFLFFGFSYMTQAQSGQTASTSDSIAFLQAIQSIERNSNVKFYFLDEWVDNVYVNQAVLGTDDFNRMMNDLLASTTLDYHQEGDKIILVKNTSIITTPAMAQYFDNSDKQTTNDSEIFFTQDQLARNQSEDNRLHTIGVRSRFTADAKSTVAGYITDSQSGDPVEGAFVYIQSPYIGTSTDAQGFYSLSIPSGKRVLFVQSVNMKNTSRNLMVYSNGKLV